MFIFFLIIYLINFLAHFGVYLFLRAAFFSTNVVGQRYLGGVMLLMSFTFLLSAVWVHKQGNGFSRFAYFVTGLWEGLLLQLLIAGIVFLLIAIVASILGLSWPRQAVGGFLVFVALAVSVYGVWNVYNPTVREVALPDRAWPAAWKQKKVLMISDVHLGEILGVSYLDGLVKRIDALEPDIILIAGDLFDGMDGGFLKLKPGLAKLKAKEAIYYINGNHETYTAELDLAEMFAGTDIRHLDDEVVEHDGLRIAGLSLAGREETKDYASTISRLAGDGSKPTLMLFHIPIYFEEAAAAGVDLMLSGHTHKGQMWPFGYLTNYIFDGSDYGLTRAGELDVFTSNGLGVWGPTMRTSGRSEIVVLRF